MKSAGQGEKHVKLQPRADNNLETTTRKKTQKTKKMHSEVSEL